MPTYNKWGDLIEGKAPVASSTKGWRDQAEATAKAGEAAIAASGKKPIPAEKGVFTHGMAEIANPDTVVKHFTDIGKAPAGTEDLGELGTTVVPPGTSNLRAAIDPTTSLNTPSLKLLAGHLFSSTPDQVAGIAQKVLPGSTLRQDVNGSPIISFQGKDYYLNKPGVSRADVLQLAGDMISFAPAGRLSAAIPSMALRAPIAAVAGGATSVAKDLVSDKLGSGKGVDWERAAITGATGAALSPLARSSVEGQPRDAIRRQARVAYDAVDAAGVGIPARDLFTSVSQIGNEMVHAGLDQQNTPKAWQIIQRLGGDLTQAAQSGRPVSLNNLDIIRQMALSVREDTRLPTGELSGEGHLANQIIRGLDDFVQQWGHSPAANAANPNVQGGVGRVADTITEARRLWGIQAKAGLVEKLISRAQLDEGQVGWQSALRANFRTLARSPEDMARFTPDEQVAVRAIVNGGPITQALRVLGKSDALSGGVIGGALGFTSGNAVGMGPEVGGAAASAGALAGPVVAATANAGKNSLALSRANDLSNIVRGGTVTANPYTAALSSQIAPNVAELRRPKVKGK